MSEGAWIFLSHSHKDFDKVKDLRNELERQGHHPLLFFLKCLDDDSEIDGLIRREIEARSWFILCDSANSRSSRWVGEERKIIASLSTHTSAMVDLEDPLTTQLSSISGLTKRATVFLSCASFDGQSAKRIEDSLRADDFGVFSPLQIPPSVSWDAEIESALNAAVDRGAVLVLLSQSSMTSEWLRHEVKLALERAEPHTGRRNIVPVFLDPPQLTLEFAPPDMLEMLGRIQGFDFSTGEFAENMARLKRWLRTFEWQP
jgi:TIR domain-containing protein